MRMHRPGDLGVLPRSADHLVDGRSGEGLATFRGEDVWSLGFLLALQSFEADGFVALQVVGAVDRTLEPPDGTCAFAPIDVVPTEIAQLADPEAVEECHQR